jgi:hypothetical protein
MAQSARSPQPARTYELGTLPPATPRRDELLSAVPKYPTPPGSPAPLKRPSTSSSITPEETAFRRSQALTRPGHVEVGRNGTVVQLNPQGKTGGLMYAPPVPRHELDTPNYHPRRMCELTKFEETKNRTAHDYTAKMRDRRTNAGASLDVRGIDTCYGRKSLHTGFVEAVYAQPYPTSFRSGAGFGYATSR